MDAQTAGVTVDKIIPEAGTDKVACCKACYDPANGEGCLAYYLHLTNFDEGECHILSQTKATPTGSQYAFPEPWPGTCPMGGYTVGFHGLGLGGRNDDCAACYWAQLHKLPQMVIDGCKNYYCPDKLNQKFQWLDCEPGLCDTAKLPTS